MAAVDAAKAAAIECWYPPTDKEVKHLGYVKAEGGVWESSSHHDGQSVPLDSIHRTVQQVVGARGGQLVAVQMWTLNLLLSAGLNLSSSIVTHFTLT